MCSPIALVPAPIVSSDMREMKTWRTPLVASFLLSGACLGAPVETGTGELGLDPEEEDAGEVPFRDCEEGEIQLRGCATYVCTEGWFRLSNADDELCEDGFECTIDSCDPESPEANWNNCVTITDSTLCPDDGLGCTVDECDISNAQNSSGCYHRPDDGRCGSAYSCLRPTCSTTNGCEYPPDYARAEEQLRLMNEHVQPYYDEYTAALALHDGSLGHNGAGPYGLACQGPWTCGGLEYYYSDPEGLETYSTCSGRSSGCSYGKSCADVNGRVATLLAEIVAQFAQEPAGTCWDDCIGEIGWIYILRERRCFNHYVVSCARRFSGPGSVRYWDHWNGSDIKAAPIGAFWVRYPYSTEEACATQAPAYQ